MADSVTNQTCESFLSDVFPNKTRDQIRTIIQLIEEHSPGDTYEEKIESMVNLLSGQEDEEGAVGYNIPTPTSIGPDDYQGNQNFMNLMQVFPDASPEYMRKFYEGRKHSFDIEEAVETLSKDGYEMVELDPIVVWEQLKDALPSADPSYLKQEAKKLAVQSPQQLEKFVNDAIENNDYPTMQDYLKRKKEEEGLNLYSDDYFNADLYLEIIPNPEQTFRDPQRKLPLAVSDNVNEDDVKFAITFLYNQYTFIRKRHIDLVFKWKKRNLIEVCDALDKLKKGLKMPRDFQEAGNCKNLALLQEVAYLKHRKLIRRFIKHKDESYRLAKEEARKFNLLETCQCCFDDELIPEECFFCMKDCTFCKDCVRRGAETIIGKGEIKFPCFNNCDSQFSARTLQMVLPKKPFERLLQRIQSEEIKQAEVEGLETCPFCDFAVVLPETEKILKCENPECLIESCRQCRHESHIPLRCNEIEYDEDVRRRTFIENKMTEALTRTCYSCKKSFIKSTGCNKMTCNCGAKMCYLCGAENIGYSHFGLGRCALFTNDVEINLNRVRQNAEQAKQELGDVEIKFDPTVNIEAYFQG